MKNNFLLIFIVFFSSCSLPLSISPKGDSNIEIKYEHYSLNRAQSLLDLSVLIPYKSLVLTKDANGFYSNIIYSIKLRDQNDDMLYSDSWSDSVYLKYFEKTTSSKNHISDYALIMNDSIFKKADNLYIEINDYQNHKYWTNTIELEIQDSEILSNLTLLMKKNNIYRRIIDLDDAEYSQIDTLWIKYQIADDIIDENGVRFELKEKILNLEEEYLNLKINKENINKYEINFLPIPIQNLSSNHLKIICYYKEVKKEASIFFPNKASVEYNYQMLLNPIGYLLEEEDYINYMSLTENQKKEYIVAYWENIDNPSLLNEFYSRIKYANLEFKSISNKGSDSDKGKIYIVYGKPLDIEYRISQNGDYQEIWIYRNEKFIFINRYGYYECSNC